MQKEELNNDIMGKKQMQKLDEVLHQVMDSLEMGRRDIFDIADDCHKQIEQLRLRLEESVLQTDRLIKMVDEAEALDKKARIRLMEVSKDFKRYSDEDIKEAYLTAQKIQTELVSLRQQELYQRNRREELSRQLKQYDVIARKADNFLSSANLAIKVLETNINSFTDTLEDAVKKQQIGIWIVESLEAEKRKISRELHDGPAQTIASMLIRLDLINYLFREDETSALEELISIKEMGRESLDDIRRIMFDLKPSAVYEEGLIVTLKEYFSAYESKYDFEIDFVFFGQERKYELALEIALFRLIQEAITNVRKHAGVKKAMVKLESGPSGLTIVIKDQGSGFDVNMLSESRQESYGIIGMRERAKLLGGEIKIISNPGRGTQVIFELATEGDGQSG